MMPFFAFTPADLEEYEAALTGALVQNQRGLDLVERPIVSAMTLTKHEASPGRRLRAFSMVVRRAGNTNHYRNTHERIEPELPHGPATYGALYDFISQSMPHREVLANLPLRVTPNGPRHDEMVDAIPDNYQWDRHHRDPELHPALQDLAFLLIKALTEACFAFQDPNVFYPGVDEGIEPVSDEHVALVIWGAQRELDREPRRGKPPAPLAQLPWRVQRAYVERRRYFYNLYGIGRRQYETGSFSLWDIPEDSEWTPPWITP